MKIQYTLARSSLISLACALSLGVACGTQPMHDIGVTEGELTTPQLPVAEFTTDMAGVWIGEAEDPFALGGSAPYQFPSGATRILLEIPEDPDATPHLTFGSGTPPAPATDPDIGYPVADPNFVYQGRVSSDDSIRPPTEAFRYELTRTNAPREEAVAGFEGGELSSGRLLDGKIDLMYSATQSFSSWCELQTADSCPSGQAVQVIYDENDSTESCSFGAEETAIDCQKMSLCANQVCTCTGPGEACRSSYQASSLTLRLSEDGLIGLFSNAVFLNERGFQQPVGVVRFHRSEP
jgi:hypothetical protein